MTITRIINNGTDSRGYASLVFVRDGKVYRALVDNTGVAIEITSATGPSNFKRFNRDRCPALYNALECAVA